MGFVSALLCVLLATLPASAQCENAAFLPGTGPRGFDGKIRATALWDRDGAGGQPPALVAAGEFRVAGTVFANNIALWNGAAWEPLGAGTPAGLNGEIHALAVLPNNELVAGGIFRMAGGGTAERVARWNGTAWSGLGTGMSPATGSIVYSLSVMPDGDLIAAGHFTHAGGIPAANIARWDGANWSALGAGVGNSAASNVFATLVRPDGKLIAAGTFTGAGGVAAANIAAWDGNAWSPLGAGLSPFLHALSNLPNGDLAAGGTGVSRWNGTAWTGMNAGFANVSESIVYDLRVLADGALAAGGSFTAGGGVNVAVWNGASWGGLGGGAPAQFVHSLTAAPDGGLVIGGNIVQAGNVAVRNIARWDGSKWNAFGGTALNGPVTSFARMPNGDLVAGGDFAGATIDDASGVARRTAAGWEPLGRGMTNVRALAVLPDGNLLAAGRFQPPGSQTPQPLAVWDGDSWLQFTPDTSPFPDIQALAVMPNGDVVAGGVFTSLGGFPVTSLARWNGARWSAIGPAMTGTVRAVAVLADGGLVIGGDFDTAGGIPAKNTALWNGTVWSAPGGGVNGGVMSLFPLPDGGFLAGGRFGTAGGKGASRIARWNGSSWEALGPGLSPIGTPYVNAISVLRNGDVIIGGVFTRAGSAGTLSVARWNGTDWSGLGGAGAGTAVPGEPGGVNALLSSPEGGFAMGGSFMAVDGGISYGFAEWGCPPAPSLGGVVLGANGFRFSFQGLPGKTYGVSYSTDLQSWTVIQGGLHSPVTYEDQDPQRGANPHGYYRIVEQ